jgi:hypothetical protein
VKTLIPSEDVEAAIRSLDEAFRTQRRHDLWDDQGVLMCSPGKEERLRRIQARSLDALSWEDIDYLMSCADLTIGTAATVKFMLPRYLGAVLTFPAFGWYSGVAILRDRLDRCGFCSWPADQRLAAADALILVAKAWVLTATETDDVGSEDEAGQLLLWAQDSRMRVLIELRRGSGRKSKPRRG